MRIGRMLAVCVAVACLAACATAMAQPGGPGRPGRGPGGIIGGAMRSPLMLLQMEQVQKEIELLDDQKAKLRELAEKTQGQMREQFAGLRDLPEDQRRAKMEELRKQMETRAQELQKEVEGILLPHQIKRLKEIRIQMMGLRALEDTEVAKALGITDAQKEKLAAVREEAMQAMRGSMEDFRGLRDLPEDQRREKMNQMREKMQKARQEVEAKVLGVLSDEQKKTFEEIKGKAFEINWGEMRRPGGERPQGQRPGGRQRPQP